MNQTRFSNKDSEISWQKIPHEDPTNCSWNLTQIKTYEILTLRKINEQEMETDTFSENIKYDNKI